MTNKDPDVMASKVKELMLNRYKLVKKISNCWGKYRFINTIKDIYWASSIVFIKKCLWPVSNPVKIENNKANAIKTAMIDLLL